MRTLKKNENDSNKCFSGKKNYLSRSAYMLKIDITNY